MLVPSLVLTSSFVAIIFIFTRIRRSYSYYGLRSDGLAINFYEFLLHKVGLSIPIILRVLYAQAVVAGS